MTLDQALNYIHGQYHKAQPGLQRIAELMTKLGNPQKKLKCIHIAGTNGKGSTAAMTASMLTSAGYKTGLFTSPYLYRFNERMQIDGVQIPDESVCRLAAQVKEQADTMVDEPTEFEVVCAMGYLYFLEENCDIVVLECGMGGEKDATNIIECPEVAVITNIGLDHTDALGDTLEKIATAKAGILKENGTAVIYRGTEGVEATVEAICKARHVSLRKADFDSVLLHSAGLEGQVFDCGGYENLEIPLLGEHQLYNCAVALAIVEQLRQKGWCIPETAIRQGLKAVVWPGRFDIVGRNPLFIIDGGHNPQCMDALVKNVLDYLPGKRIIALTGVLNDKDYGDMYRPMIPLVQGFVCITPDNPRKMAGSELAAYLRQAGAKAEARDTASEGVRLAIAEAGEDGVVLCFGSLYTIGAIQAALEEITE